MTFAEERQLELLANALDLEQFAENVEIEGRTVRVKIEHESLLATGKPVPRNSGTQTVAEFERILVLVSRVASWTYSLPTRPQPGHKLLRDADHDGDTRPFLFAGDVEFEGLVHAKYYFQRPRRVVQGGR